jgi:hypothetical protein
VCEHNPAKRLYSHLAVNSGAARKGWPLRWFLENRTRGRLNTLPNYFGGEERISLLQKWQKNISLCEHHHYIASVLHQAIVIVQSQRVDGRLHVLFLLSGETTTRSNEAARKIEDEPSGPHSKRVDYIGPISLVGVHPVHCEAIIAPFVGLVWSSCFWQEVINRTRWRGNIHATVGAQSSICFVYLFRCPFPMCLGLELIVRGMGISCQESTPRTADIRLKAGWLWSGSDGNQISTPNRSAYDIHRGQNRSSAAKERFNRSVTSDTSCFVVC